MNLTIMAAVQYPTRLTVTVSYPLRLRVLGNCTAIGSVVSGETRASYSDRDDQMTFPELHHLALCLPASPQTLHRLSYTRGRTKLKTLLDGSMGSPSSRELKGLGFRSGVQGWDTSMQTPDVRMPLLYQACQA